MELLAEDLPPSPRSPRDRRALDKVEVVQRECQRLQDLLDDFLNFAKVRRLKLEPSDLNEQVRQVLDFFRPKARRGADRAGRLPRRRPAHGAVGPRGVSRGPVEPGAQRPAGHARRRATGGPHLRHGRRRGPGPDRHRLRHGRGHAGPDVRRLLLDEAAAARAWACPRRARSSRPTAARSACRASRAAARSSRSSSPRSRGSRPTGRKKRRNAARWPKPPGYPRAPIFQTRHSRFNPNRPILRHN